MDMKTARASLFALLVPVAAAVCAQQTFEVIPLRHSTVDQVLPVLRPLLEPGGTLSGHSGQLIVRASPRNVEELRRALESIDRPRRRLQISVRFDDSDAARDAASRRAGAFPAAAASSSCGRRMPAAPGRSGSSSASRCWRAVGR